jgi:hypothetical protein
MVYTQRMATRIERCHCGSNGDAKVKLKVTLEYLMGQWRALQLDDGLPVLPFIFYLINQLNYDSHPLNKTHII